MAKNTSDLKLKVSFHNDFLELMNNYWNPPIMSDNSEVAINFWKQFTKDIMDKVNKYAGTYVESLARSTFLDLLSNIENKSKELDRKAYESGELEKDECEEYEKELVWEGDR